MHTNRLNQFAYDKLPNPGESNIWGPLARAKQVLTGGEEPPEYLHTYMALVTETPPERTMVNGCSPRGWFVHVSRPATGDAKHPEIDYRIVTADLAEQKMTEWEVGHVSAVDNGQNTFTQLVLHDRRAVEEKVKRYVYNATDQEKLIELMTTYVGLTINNWGECWLIEARGQAEPVLRADAEILNLEEHCRQLGNQAVLHVIEGEAMPQVNPAAA